MVPDPQHALIGKAAVYARVSTHEQRDDLDRQAQRMTEFANAAGLSVVAVIKEVTSGVNDTGPKLTALLKEDSWGMLGVEHKDRLSRVGFGWFDVLLGLQGRRIVVADAATEDKAICSRISCGSSTAWMLACTGWGRRDAGPMT